MVAWYKHDIPAWMDGTASLSDPAYRAYHVICQQMYLNEGPISINERMLAGACNQSLKAFRIILKELIDAGKLTEVDGRLTNFRVVLELESVANNRKNAGKGGKNSGKSRNKDKNDNENNADDEATLPENRTEKTRLEETRLEKKAHTAKAVAYDEVFEAFWSAYPSRQGGNPKPPAAKIFLAAVKSGAEANEIIEGAKRFSVSESRNINTPYIPQAVKWLRDKRWLDNDRPRGGPNHGPDIRGSLI